MCSVRSDCTVPVRPVGRAGAALEGVIPPAGVPPTLPPVVGVSRLPVGIPCTIETAWPSLVLIRSISLSTVSSAAWFGEVIGSAPNQAAIAGTEGVVGGGDAGGKGSDRDGLRPAAG